ncbi:YPDG domain-containing protein [Corynebacterium evansiae]
MKSIAAAGAVLALATTGTVVVHSQAAPVAYAQDATEGAGAANSNEPIVADAIANGYIKSGTDMSNAKSTLSGRAFIDDGYGFTPTDAGQRPVPEGTEVFMQWIDKDGAVSPVYVAKTTNQLTRDKTSQAGPGAYAFDLRKPWVDHHGKEHTYTASANQYYKLWINPFEDERNGFTVYPFRQVGGFFPGAFRDSAGADQQGAWNTIGTNMQRTSVLMQADRDVPYMHKPKSEWVNDETPTVPRQATNPAMKGHVGGKVWHETTDARLNGPNDVGDVPASGMYVVMSVLTKEGAGAYAAAVDTLPEAQQLAAAKKLLEEHPEYIAATVRSKVGADGYYSVKFPEGTLTNETKKYLYAHVETADGEIPSGYSAWRIPLFNSPENNGTRNPAPIAAENLVQNPMWYNVNFALVPRHNVSLDITNFDMIDNPAKPGDVAQLDVKGPFPVTPNKIVWKKNNGEVVKTCEGIDSVAKANECTLTVPEDAKEGDVFTAEFVTGDDTSLAADSFIVREATQADTVEPAYEDKLVVPGEETKSSPSFTDKDGKDVEVPEGSKFSIGEDFKAPEGYTVGIDESTGEITVTVDGDKLNEDTVEEFDVPVTVTYPDETTDEVKANFKLDTDNDGKPDTEDEDDDNDGIPDEEEKDKGSNPKDKGSIPATPIEPGNPTNAATFEPEYEGKLVVPGEETKSTPTFKDKDGKDVKAPEGSKFTIPEDFKAPEGYEVKIDENTGEITVTFPDGSKLDKDTVEEFDVPVTVTYPDETTDEVKANFKLDTDGDGKPDTEDEDDDNDGIPDGEDSNPKIPNQNLDFTPEYEDGSGKPGEDVKVPAPEFKGKDGQPTDAPDGTTFKPGENAPDGVKVDENTGEITVPVPEDAKPGDKITVPVEVTYPDGSKDNVDVTVTVEEPDVKDKDADTFEPGYEDGSGKPGEDVKVPAPEFKGKDGQPTDAPDGTTFKPGENAPDGVKVDENTGEITVPVPEDAKPGDKITVPVEVTYPDGSKDNVDVTVTVEEPEVPAKVDYRPAYGGPVVVPAGGSKTAEITYDGPKAPEGTKYVLDPNYTVPNGWDIKVDEATGKVTATVVEAGPNGARQEELVVPVQVQYPESANATGNDVANATFLLDTDKDGTPDTTDKDDDGDGVTDQDEKDKGSDPKDPNSKPEAPVNDFQPSYEEKTVPAGQSVTSDVTFTGEPKPEGTKFSIADNFVAPHGWSFEVDPETGAVTATVVPAGPDGARQEQVIVPIVVTYPDGTATSNDTANAVFNLDTDGDGTPDSKDDDDDNDGVTDEVEKEKGSDPKDPDSKPQPDAPAEDPKWEDTTTTPDKPVDIPNTGGDVPADTTVETNGPGTAEIKPDGTIVVTPNEDAKPGDKIEVIVKDKDGNEIDRVVVEVEQPEAPAEKPDWKDDSGKPGDKVEIPNNGGDVPAGTTVETDGPGKAEIDENGKLIVDIDKDAKPGDKVVVVVKDKDGNEIDRVVVEVEKPEAPAKDPKWEDTTTTPDKPVEIPNTGGDVPAGTTVETEGPGKAEIDENGKITVTPDKDAKPGDKIKVVVKDKDGKVIDEVTVTVTDKDDQGGPVGSVKDPNKIGAIIGGTIVGSGLIGALLGNHGDGAGSSAPGKPGKPGAEKPGKPGEAKPGKGADKGAKPGKAGNQSAGKGSTGATSQSTEAGSRGGSLAVTGVSGLAITLGASVIALALGGALMALRRRQS